MVGFDEGIVDTSVALLASARTHERPGSVRRVGPWIGATCRRREIGGRGGRSRIGLELHREKEHHDQREANVKSARVEQATPHGENPSMGEGCPFGGMRMSGGCRELGQEGLEEFRAAKHFSGCVKEVWYPHP